MQTEDQAVLAKLKQTYEVAERLGRNAVIDLRFGQPLAFSYLRNKKQSNTDYRTLETIFADRIRSDDVLVDVGSGAGRVINHWLRRGRTTPIYGLELDPRLASQAARRLKRRSHVTIIQGDAVTSLPEDGTLFFLFNPFDRDVMDRFVAKLLTLPVRPDAPVRVLYLNPKHLGAFENVDRLAIELVPHDPNNDHMQQDLAVITVS